MDTISRMASFRRALIVPLVAVLSGCSGDGNGTAPSAGCDSRRDGSYRGRPSDWGGNAYLIRAEIRGGVIYISEFHAECSGVYPDGRGCGDGMSGFDPPAPATLDGDCAFSLDVSDGLLRIEIDGTVDPEDEYIGGSYRFYYGTCCQTGGRWWATKATSG